MDPTLTTFKETKKHTKSINFLSSFLLFVKNARSKMGCHTGLIWLPIVAILGSLVSLPR